MSNYYLCGGCRRKGFDWSPTEVFCSAYDEVRPKIVHADNDERPSKEVCKYFGELYQQEADHCTKEECND